MVQSMSVVAGYVLRRRHLGGCADDDGVVAGTDGYCVAMEILAGDRSIEEAADGGAWWLPRPPFRRCGSMGGRQRMVARGGFPVHPLATSSSPRRRRCLTPLTAEQEALLAWPVSQ